MTRGVLVGEIMDSLSNLNNQVKIRCSLGFTDLNKFSEDFFAGLLSRIYDINLKNLNSERSNEPGLDLGDESNSIAFQVTSQADSSKINSTLEKITEAQKTKFKIIKILIIGEKQNSYSAIKPQLIEKFSFTRPGRKDPEDFVEFNIIDTKNLLRDLMGLEVEQIYEIHKFVAADMQRVIIDLEIPKRDGTYNTSLLSRVEIAPETKAKNASLILDDNDFNALSLSDINGFFDQLASVTRVTREVYYFIIAKGEFRDDTFHLYQDEAVRMLGISNNKLQEELTILRRKRLIYEPDEIEPELTLLLIKEELGYMLLRVKEDLDLYKIIVGLDFTKLDKD